MNSAEVGTIQALESLDSLESKINQTQVAYQQFYTTIGIEEVWKKFLDGATNAINTLNSLPKAFGKIPTGAVAMVVNVIGLIKTVLRSGANEIAKVVTNVVHEVGAQGQAAAQQEGQNTGRSFVNGMNKPLSEAWALPNLKASFSGVATVVGQSLTTMALMMDKTSESGRTLSSVLSGLGGSAQLIGGLFQGWAGIPNILMGIMNIINANDLWWENSAEELERLTEEARQLNDEAKIAKAEYNSLQRTADKLDELKVKRYESVEAEQEYEEAVESLASKLPALIDGTDELGVVSINTGNMEKELARLREQTAERTLEAIEAEKAQNQKDLDNTKEEQRERRTQINNPDLLAEPNHESYQEINKILSEIWFNNRQLSEEEYDKAGFKWDGSLQEFIITDYDALNSYLESRQDIFNKLSLSSDDLKIDPTILINDRIKALRNFTGSEEDFLKKAGELVTFIYQEGLQVPYENFLAYYGELRKGAREIESKNNKLESTEIALFDQQLQQYIDSEDEFYSELKNGQVLLSQFLRSQSEKWLSIEENEGKKTEDYLSSLNFEKDYENFQKAINSIAQSLGEDFSEIWSNLDQYTLQDFKKALTEEDAEIYQVIESYYEKYIPDYTKKLKDQLFGAMAKNFLPGNSLNDFYKIINNLQNGLSKDLYTWLSSSVQLAQDYIDKGFVTAGNAIISDLTSITQMLDSEKIDYNTRNQIVKAFKEANISTPEGVNELIKTLNALDIKLPDRLIPTLENIQKQLTYNIPLALQAYGDEINTDLDAFTKAIQSASKGLEIGEAQALAAQIASDGKGAVSLKEFGQKSGKFYLEDAELRRRYIESLTAQYASTIGEVRTKIDEILKGEQLAKLNSIFNENAFVGLEKFQIDDYSKLYSDILLPYGFAKEILDEKGNSTGQFQLDTEALKNAGIKNGQSLTEFLTEYVNNQIEGFETARDYITSFYIRQSLLQAGEIEEFLDNLLGEENKDLKARALQLIESQDWGALVQEIPGISEWLSTIKETYADSYKKVYEQIISAIGTKDIITPDNVTGPILHDLAQQEGSFIEEFKNEVTGEITYLIKNTKEAQEAMVNAINNDEHLKPEEAGQLAANTINSFKQNTNDALLKDIIQNADSMDEETYQILYNRMQLVSENAATTFKRLFNQTDSEGNHIPQDSLANIVNILTKIIPGLTTNAIIQQEESILEQYRNVLSDLDKGLGDKVTNQASIDIMFKSGFDFDFIEETGEYLITKVGSVGEAAEFTLEEIGNTVGHTAEDLQKVREYIRNNFKKISDDLVKGIGEEVSDDSADILEESGYRIDIIDGQNVITSIGNLELAFSKLYDAMQDSFVSTAAEMKEVRQAIIAAHNDNKIKGADFVDTLTDLEMGLYADFSSVTEALDSYHVGNEIREKLKADLEKVGAHLEKDILMTTENTDPIGLNKAYEAFYNSLIKEAERENNIDLKNYSEKFLAQVQDSTIDLIASYGDLISKGIEGSLTNVEALDLKKFAANHGIDLNFRETIKGLKLSQDQAIQLYQVMKQIDSLQAQITFQQLSDSLIENNSNFRNMTTLLAHIKDLNNEINDLPVGSKRREEYERELAVAQEIKETRSMTDPEYFDFMSGDLPDPMKGAETYWNSVNKAFTVMNQASESGYMSLTDFYNLANHMNDVAKQTGKTTEFMGVTLDGSLESASALIQKGYRAIENVDGEGAMVSLKAFGDNFEKGAAAMESGMQRGAKRMAKDQIEMLDAMIGLLEVVVAFEEFNELDIEGNGLDWYELFTPVGTDKEGNQIFEANEGTKKLAKQILDKAENDKDLKRALDEIIIDGTPLRKTMEDAANGNKLTKEKMEEYTKTIGILAKAAAEGDYSTENLTKLIQETFAGDEGTHEITVYGQTFAVKGDIVIKKENGKYTVNGKSFNTLDEAITAQELSDKYGIEKAYSNGKQVYGDIKVSQDTKIQVSKNIETSEEKITFNGQSYKTVDEALEAAIRSDYDKAVAKGYEGSIEDYIIENNLVAKFKLTSTQVSNIVGEPVSNLSDEMLKELGIDDKLVAAIEIGIEKALANFNLAQAIMDNLVPDFSFNEFGMAYAENPQVIALGEQLGKGIAPQITEAIKAGLAEYYGTSPIDISEEVTNALIGKTVNIDQIDAIVNNTNISELVNDPQLNLTPEEKEQMQLIIDTIKAHADEINITDITTSNLGQQLLTTLASENSGISVPEAAAMLEKLNIIQVNNPELPADQTLDVPSANLHTDEATISASNVELTDGAKMGKTSVEASDVEVSSTGTTSLANAVQAEVEAKIGAVDVSSIETAQQTITTAASSASTGLSTLGTNIDTVKDKVNNLANSLNNITENGPTQAKNFKTALNDIKDSGPKHAENFKNHLKDISSNGPNQAQHFKEAVNAIASYGPNYARDFVNAVNSMRSRTVDVTVNVSVTGSGLNARATITPRAKGNVALAGGKKQTLMGELGPELYVTNGHYYIAGQNGAEMVDLPDDAIVFNHLQTKKLLGSGKSGRGKPVTNEKNAVSYATGNAIGPAMASARETLALLKQLREMWKAMLNASSKQLGIQSGKSDKKTDTKDKTPKTSDTPTKDSGGSAKNPTQDKISDNVDDIADDIHNAKPGHVVDTIQDLYNELREIESLTRKIEYQSNLQKLFENDRYNNGKQIGETIAKQYEMLGDLLESQKAVYEKESKLLQQEIANYEATPYGQFYEVVGDKVELTDLDWLKKLFEEDSTGAGINNATSYKTQVQTLLNKGFGLKDLLWDLNGNKVVDTYAGIDVMFDENGKQLDEAQMSQVWQNMVQNFVSRLDNYRDGFQERLDSLNDRQNEIVDIVSQRNDILNEMIDLQKELENEVLDALVDQRQAIIDGFQKEKDAYEETAKAYLDGLNKTLQREKQMYQNQQNNSELIKLQRQLEILRRSGGSSSQIKNLEDQIQSKQQDAYFNQREQEIDAIQEASDLQIQKMDEEIALMTETLNYERENGLLWARVAEIMQGDSTEIANFIAENKKGWGGKSALAKTEDINDLVEKFDTLDTLKNTPDIVKDTITKVGDNLEAAVEKAGKVNADEEYDNGQIADAVPESQSFQIGNNNSNNNSNNNNNYNSSGGNNYTESYFSTENDRNGSLSVYNAILKKMGRYNSEAVSELFPKINLADEEKKYTLNSAVGAANKRYSASYKDGEVVITLENPYEKLSEYEIKQVHEDLLNYNKAKYLEDLATNRYADAMRSSVSNSDIDYTKFKKTDVKNFKAIKDFANDKGRKNSEEREEYQKKYTDTNLQPWIKLTEDELKEAREIGIGGPFQRVFGETYLDPNNEYIQKRIAEIRNSPNRTYHYFGSREKMEDWLKFFEQFGFSQGGYVVDYQKVAHKNGDDTIAFNTLKRGEAVLNTEQSSQFKKLTDNLPMLQSLLNGTNKDLAFKELILLINDTMNNYAKTSSNIEETLNTLSNQLLNNQSNIEPSINIEKIDFSMNVSKLSNDYDAERAGEAVFNKMVQLARKSGKTNSIARR